MIPKHLLLHPVEALVDCLPCEDWLFEAWERMTYGGAVAQYDTIVPNNLYTEIGGQRVSYPYVAR